MPGATAKSEKKKNHVGPSNFANEIVLNKRILEFHILEIFLFVMEFLNKFELINRVKISVQPAFALRRLCQLELC